MSLLRLTFLFTLAAAAAAAQSSPDILDRLVGNSPFLPVAGVEPTRDGPAQFEFRSVVAEEDGLIFSVFDHSRRKAEWIRLNESDRPIVIRNYDAAGERLTIEHHGQFLTLPLKRAPVNALAPAQPGAPSSAAAPGRPPPGAEQQQADDIDTRGSGTSAREAERLQQIADEIRRRRTFRDIPPAEPPANRGR